MEEADIVVIGAGSGGSAAAGRLSEDGRYTVAVLEAGGRNTGLRTIMPGMMPMQTEKTNWQYETVPQPGLNGRRGYQPRGKGLGGSSAINAMIYIRGHAWDYDNWAAMGCHGWSWADVLPVFKRAERNENGADEFHGDAGPLHVSNQRSIHPASRAFVEAAANLQLPVTDDFNGARQEGAGIYQVTQWNGERWTSARAYLGNARDRDNLAIITETTVERVLFEDGRVWGVAYLRDGQSKVIRARRAVVLAGGVFGTAQVLMLSGIGPGAHLQEMGLAVQVDRSAVGSNLQDHIDYTASFESSDRTFFGKTFLGNLWNLRQVIRWLTSRQGAMTTPFAESGAFLKTHPDLPVPDIQLHFVRAIVEDHGRADLRVHGYSGHVCVLRPESTGTVRLASLDARAVPLIDPQFLSDRRDVDLLMQGARIMHRILDTPPMRDVAGRDRNPIDINDDDALERLIRARSDTIYHPVGTARMGSDTEAVCDPKLRVRGVEGLYVADASIMPKLIGGNTNAPSMMIGERCSDFVKADLAA